MTGLVTIGLMTGCGTNVKEDLKASEQKAMQEFK